MTSIAPDMIDLPGPGRHQPRLDGVRAIAVLLVMLVHCVPLPDRGVVAWILRHTFSNGWFGVDIFFALSGYLITSILLRARTERHYYRNFYMRRILRIFPLYYGVLMVLWLAAPFLPFGPMRPVWPYATYTSNFAIVFMRAEWAPLGHTWSLAIEEQFYLIYPVVVFHLSTRSLRVLLWSIIAVSPLLRVITNALTFPGASYFATFCRFDVLAMGALIAVELTARKTLTLQTMKRMRWALGGLIATSLLLWLTKQVDFKKVFFNLAGLTIVDATAALFVCVAAIGPGARLDRLLQHPLAVGLGRISYGIYLLHLPVALLAKTFFFERLEDTWLRTIAVAILSVGVTLVLACLSWVSFEQPILRLKRWFYDSSEKPDASVAPTN